MITNKIRLFKKFITFILVAIILFNAEGFFLCFTIMQEIIREKIEKQMISGISDNELIKVVIPLNSDNTLCWTKPGKEFTYNGMMYDVVKTEYNSHNKIYYCINDVKEKKIIDFFYKNHNKKKEADRNLKRVLNNLYTFQQFTFLKNILPEYFRYPNFQLDCYKTFLEITSPPPRTI